MTQSERLRAALQDALQDAPHRGWLDSTLAATTERTEMIKRFFPAAGRHMGREPLPGMPGWGADEAARALLLTALPQACRAAETCDLYWHGDADEKRAVLKALPLLDIGAAALPVLHDAIRTNDARLVAAALGPCARDLDQTAWRQAVFKCVFMGVPLTAVDRLQERADTALAGMLAAFAEERAAAGRSVPSDAAALFRGLTEET